MPVLITLTILGLAFMVSALLFLFRKRKTPKHTLLILFLPLLLGNHQPGCSCENFLYPEYDFRFQVSNRADDPIEPFLFDESLGYFPPGHLDMRSKRFAATDYPTVADYYVMVIFSARNLTTGKLSKPQKVKLHLKSTPLIEFTNWSFRYYKVLPDNSLELIEEIKIEWVDEYEFKKNYKKLELQ